MAKRTADLRQAMLSGERPATVTRNVVRQNRPTNLSRRRNRGDFIFGRAGKGKATSLATFRLRSKSSCGFSRPSMTQLFRICSPKR